MPVIKAQKREAGKAYALRAEGKLPAVIYGPHVGSQAVMLDLNPFVKLYNEVGESTLIDMSVDGGTEYKVLIQDIQRDPVSDQIIHVDLRQLEMDKEIDAEIELEFTGEPPAVKELAGVLVKSLDNIEVRCLPKDLPGSIMVDLSVLKTFNDYIHVKDLPIGHGVKVLTNPEETVATVIAQQEEKEEVAPMNVADVEVVGKKKEDAAEGEGEGEEKKPGDKPEKKSEKGGKKE